jgi:hypothetical protein
MDFSSLFSFIGDAIDSQVSALADFTVQGFGSVLGDITSLFGLQSGFIDWAKTAIHSIITWLSHVWDWLRNHILSKIISKIQDIISRLRKWLKPLIDWIKLERALLLQNWNQYIKPLLNFIQHLRQALVLFRLLGFKWAKSLDQYLVNLENKINAGFLGAWKNLNILASWINWITDPLGLWSSNVWFGALGQSLSAIWAMVWGAPQSGLGAQQLAADQQLTQNYFITQQRVQIGERAGLAGPLPADISNANSVMAQLQALGYNPPLF